MVFAVTWNDSFESIPDDESFGYDIDTYLNNLKIAVRERAEIEHVWKVGATDGQHVPGLVRVIKADIEANILAYSGKANAFALATDTKKLYRNTADGVNWVAIDLDHGSLSGLTDDDHTIYLLADGTRALTGDLDINSNKVINLATPTADGDGARKKYVDDLIDSIVPDLVGDYASSSFSITGNDAWNDLLSVDIVVLATSQKNFFDGYLYSIASVDTSILSIRIYDSTTSSELIFGKGTYFLNGNILHASVMLTGLTVATHTIKLQVKKDSGTAAVYNRSLSILGVI